MMTANVESLTTDEITVIQSLLTNPKHILLNSCVGICTFWVWIALLILA